MRRGGQVVDYRFAYLIVDAFGACIWLSFFLGNRRLRRKMLMVSLWAAPWTPVLELFHSDYWQPAYVLQIGGVALEDVLGGFLIAGITAVFFDVVFRETVEPGATREPLSTLILMLLVGFLSMALFNLVLGMNSIYAATLFSLAVGLYVVMRRPDLIRRAVANATITASLVVPSYLAVCYVFPDVFEIGWKLQNLSHWFVAGIPIEEIMWAFALGFSLGPLYEFFSGQRRIERTC
jgi:hypothetical protein